MATKRYLLKFIYSEKATKFCEIVDFAKFYGLLALLRIYELYINLL